MEEGRWLRQARVRRSMALRSDRGRFNSPGVSVTCNMASVTGDRLCV